LERERFWVLGVGSSAGSAFPLVGRLPAGFRPFAFVLDRPLVPAGLFGGTVPFASAVPSVAVERFGAALGGAFGSFATGGDGFSFSSLAEPISRSAATGVTMPVRNITSCVPIRMAEDTTM
jgi:hypothetical protein